MRTINVGVIGTGGIASNQHMPALQKQPDIKIMAVCDTNEESAKRAAERFSVPHIFTDYKKLLEMDEIEAVHICTPNFMHAQPAIDALNAGKHVIVEKPLARSAVEGAPMVDAARKNKKKFMVAQNVRFGSDIQALKRYIDAGDLGDIYFGRVWALRRRGVPSWGVFTDKEKQGGGPLIDIGVHVLDLTLYLMGHPKPISASGQAFTKLGNTPGHVGAYGPWNWQNYTVEDYAAGFVRLDNGASLIIESSFAANIAEDVMRSSLLGTKGGAETHPVRIFGEEKEMVYDLTPKYLPNVSSYEVEIRGFYDAILNDTEPPVTGEQALNVMKILDAIYKSSEEGKEVLID
ncbi:MAG: Gfo/Idh/MocA family oxidoreductase [Armatimonadota bacterium]|nr:Gfo/Idh/MocA family oxidoreductase [bacterium]